MRAIRPLMLCIMLVALQWQSALAEESRTPTEVIEATANGVQSLLVGQRAYYADHATELYNLVDRLLLPSFDVEYAGKQVLGKEHWNAATVEQRTKFIEVFYGFLIKTYAKGVLEFDQDRLTVLPDPSYSKDGRKVLVRTQLMLDGSDDILINYALRQTPDGWKIYDVRIDGVSYIKNYRSQFDAEISARGIDAVIQRLEEAAAGA